MTQESHPTPPEDLDAFYGKAPETATGDQLQATFDAIETCIVGSGNAEYDDPIESSGIHQMQDHEGKSHTFEVFREQPYVSLAPTDGRTIKGRISPQAATHLDIQDADDVHLSFALDCLERTADGGQAYAPAQASLMIGREYPNGDYRSTSYNFYINHMNGEAPFGAMSTMDELPDAPTTQEQATQAQSDYVRAGLIMGDTVEKPDFAKLDEQSAAILSNQYVAGTGEISDQDAAAIIEIAQNYQ
jgi:hypothetical protein